MESWVTFVNTHFVLGSIWGSENLIARVREQINETDPCETTFIDTYLPELILKTREK